MSISVGWMIWHLVSALFPGCNATVWYLDRFYGLSGCWNNVSWSVQTRDLKLAVCGCGP